MSDKDDLHEIADGLAELDGQSQRGPALIDQAYRAMQEARRLYDAERAAVRAELRNAERKLTVPDTEAEVDLQTMTLRKAFEDADAAHRKLAAVAAEIRDRRSSYQTRAKLVMEQMKLAGYQP